MTGRRAGLALLVYAVGVFIVAGLAAWPLLMVRESLGVKSVPLHELTADLLKLVALLGLWPLLKVTADLRAQSLGFSCGGQALRGVLRGFVAGVFTMAGTVAVLVFMGVRVVRPELQLADLFEAFAKAIVIALPVAIIEEFWFRGALTRVCRPLGMRTALVLVAFLYAAVHFIRPDVQVLAPYVWYDGIVAELGMFGRMTDVTNIDAFAALLAAGLLLGLVRHRDGCIAGCVGWHAGWVFVIQASRRLTEREPQAGAAWLASKYDGTIGWLFLLVAACVIIHLYRRSSAALNGAGAHRRPSR